MGPLHPAYERINRRFLSLALVTGRFLGSSTVQQAPRGLAVLDNRPMHRSLRNRRGPAHERGCFVNRPGATGETVGALPVYEGL